MKRTDKAKPQRLNCIILSVRMMPTSSKKISDKQIQAFGWASFGYGFEAGYISIDELLELAELDLYFTPCPVGQVIREG